MNCPNCGSEMRSFEVRVGRYICDRCGHKVYKAEVRGNDPFAYLLGGLLFVGVLFLAVLAAKALTSPSKEKGRETIECLLGERK